MTLVHPGGVANMSPSFPVVDLGPTNRSGVVPPVGVKSLECDMGGYGV